MAKEDFNSLPRSLQNLLRASGYSAASIDAKAASALLNVWVSLPAIVARIGREGVRRAARQAQELYSSRFANQMYYDVHGRIKRLGRNTPKYNRSKALHKPPYDKRRGHRTGALAEAIDSMVSVTPNQRGLRIALRAAAIKSGAGEYLDFYESQKAPGLGDPLSIPRVVLRDFQRYVLRKVQLEISGHVKVPGLGTRLLKPGRIDDLLRAQGFNLLRRVG